MTVSSQQAGKEARSCPCAVIYCSSSRAGRDPGEWLEFSTVNINSSFDAFDFFFFFLSEIVLAYLSKTYVLNVDKDYLCQPVKY